MDDYTKHLMHTEWGQLTDRFNDMVAAGTRYVYGVQAVDTAGNVGPVSNRVEETAR